MAKSKAFACSFRLSNMCCPVQCIYSNCYHFAGLIQTLLQLTLKMARMVPSRQQMLRLTLRILLMQRKESMPFLLCLQWQTKTMSGVIMNIIAITTPITTRITPLLQPLRARRWTLTGSFPKPRMPRLRQLWLLSMQLNSLLLFLIPSECFVISNIRYHRGIGTVVRYCVVLKIIGLSGSNGFYAHWISCFICR